MTVEKDEGIECLILGARRHMPLCGQMRQELFDFWGTHVTRMPFVVEQDEATGPLHVTAFGFQGVMLQAKDLSGLIEEGGRPWLG
jgi:hypothetical protein